MTLLIAIFGALFLVAGIAILANPQMILGYLQDHRERVELHALAVLVRLVLGALLVFQAGVSKFPLAIEILGWISIAAAIVLALIGRQKFIQLMAWALKFVVPYGRIAAVIAVAFGAFLIYAFV